MKSVGNKTAPFGTIHAEREAMRQAETWLLAFAVCIDKELCGEGNRDTFPEWQQTRDEMIAAGVARHQVRMLKNDAELIARASHVTPKH